MSICWFLIIQKILKDITNIAPEAIYIHNESNIGLSACYNQAAKYAKKHEYEMVVVFGIEIQILMRFLFLIT